MTTDDVAAVLAAYRDEDLADAAPEVPKRLVTLKEIEDNDWDLNLGRYVVTEADPEVEASVAVSAYMEGRDELRAAESLLDEKLAEAGFLG